MYYYMQSNVFRRADSTIEPADIATIPPHWHLYEEFLANHEDMVAKMEAALKADELPRGYVNHPVVLPKQPGELVIWFGIYIDVIEFESRYACPVGSGSGFGWRWIFTMLFFAALYVGGGSYYNHRTEGKVLGTVEAIPHVEYWKEVPGLVTDGLAYSYTHGKAAYEASYTQGRGAYETIKEKYSGKLPGL